MITKIIYYILKSFSILAVLEKIKSEQILKRNKLNGIIDNTAVIYNDASFINLQKDPKRIQVSKHSHVRSTLLVFAYGGEIKIGKHCYIGDNVRIWSGEKVIIGNDVIIGHNTNIIDTNSHEIDMNERKESVRKQLNIGFQEEKGNIETAPIFIGNNVWISFNVTILKGVTIGDGAIVAANSVVTKNISPNSLAAGNPAKEIKRIN
jgi:acetyltransferase-like isoleucine patch superfamily enzyme